MTHHDKTPGRPGLRETLNKNPLVVISIVVVALCVALALAFHGNAKPKAYFSADDGKSFFLATSAGKPPTRDGVDAVRAAIFTCDGGKTQFVGYLFRYKSDVAGNNAGAAVGPTSGMEVKRPGDTDWISQFDPSLLVNQNPAAQKLHDEKYRKIVEVKCPDGGDGTPTQVNPN